MDVRDLPPERTAKVLEKLKDEFRHTYYGDSFLRVNVGRILEAAHDCVMMQVATEPYITGDSYGEDGKIIYDTWKCQYCGETYEIECQKYKYCPECGQKIKWEE